MTDKKIVKLKEDGAYRRHAGDTHSLDGENIFLKAGTTLKIFRERYCVNS